MRFLILPALLLAPTPAAAEPLKPTEPWVVNYDDAQCIASRNYGTKDKPLILAFKPSPMGGVMRLLVIRPGGDEDGVQYPAKVAFGSSKPLKTNALVYGDGKLKQRVVSVNLRIADFESAMTGETVRIQVDDGTNRQFSTPQLSNVRKVLSDCLANLQDVWNVGSERQSRIKFPGKATSSLFRLFSSDDYPDQAVYERASGAARVVMLIDETGSMRDCAVEETSGVATLDTMTCYVFRKRARFEASRDQHGKPIKSTIDARINWLMP